jgi:hypothetical protein
MLVEAGDRAAKSAADIHNGLAIGDHCCTVQFLAKPFCGIGEILSRKHCLLRIGPIALMHMAIKGCFDGGQSSNEFEQ